MQSTALDVVVRKGAHFFEYAVLSFLLWRIFYIKNKFSWREAFMWSFLISLFYGVSDELHQTFTSGRTGRLIDAAFDGLSSLVALEFITLYVRKKINLKDILIFFFHQSATAFD